MEQCNIVESSNQIAINIINPITLSGLSRSWILFDSQELRVKISSPWIQKEFCE